MQPSTTLLPPMTATDRLAADAAAHLLPLRALAAPPPPPSTDAATTTFTSDSNGGAAAAIIHSGASSPLFLLVGSPLWQVESDRLDRGSTQRHGMGSSPVHADPRGGHPLRQDGLRAAFSQVCAPPATTLPACLPASSCCCSRVCARACCQPCGWLCSHADCRGSPVL